VSFSAILVYAFSFYKDTKITMPYPRAFFVSFLACFVTNNSACSMKFYKIIEVADSLYLILLKQSTHKITQRLQVPTFAIFVSFSAILVYAFSFCKDTKMATKTTSPYFMPFLCLFLLFLLPS